MNALNEIPSTLERYEMKYLIPEDMIGPISEFLSVYCSLDYYSQQSEDRFYNIYSLYFDSPNYLFLRKKISGAENRFNMRIRTYDGAEGIPCFFEIKHKLNGIVRKYRARVLDDNWKRVFHGPDYSLPECKDKKEIELFVRLAYSCQASPKVLTCYKRKAYVSEVDDYARVTFDRELRCHPEEDYNLVPDNCLLCPYDNNTVFDPDCNIILELKCYASYVPLWMLDMIRYFNLYRRSFSKYGTSLNSLSEQSGYYCADVMCGVF